MTVYAAAGDEPAYEVATARSTAVPRDVKEAAETIAATTAEGSTVAFHGSESKRGWGAPVTQVDVAISTLRLDQVVRHSPADMTISVGAGVRLAVLQAFLADYGQWLAIDPASESEGATIGGLLATADAGPRRLRYGTMRDLTIGAQFVLADGRVARSGSHVIKNVAGYDLAKLLHGSMGTLALVSEVIVRLHPRPQASAVITAELGAGSAMAATIAVQSAGIEPSAVEWRARPDGSATLGVLCEGTSRGVEAATARVAAIVPGGAIAIGPEATLRWREVVSPATADRRTSTVRFGCRPNRLPALLDGAQAVAREAGAVVDLSASLGVGVATATVSGDISVQAEVLQRLLGAVSAAGGRVMLRDRPIEIDRLLPPLAGDSFLRELHRRIKVQWDPDARFAPGRSRDWL